MEGKREVLLNSSCSHVLLGVCLAIEVFSYGRFFSPPMYNIKWMTVNPEM